MATVDAKSAELQIDKDESDALAEQGLSEYDTAQADLDALNPQEIDDAVGELKDEEEEEGGELEEAEEEMKKNIKSKLLNGLEKF